MLIAASPAATRNDTHSDSQDGVDITHAVKTKATVIESAFLLHPAQQHVCNV